MAQAEVIDHPAHYQGKGMEVIDVIEAFDLGFHLGNTFKYIARAGKKGEDDDRERKLIEDLKKARWYLDREISRRESP